MLLLYQLAPAWAAAGNPVQDGREALGQPRESYPWYDAKTDRVRRAEPARTRAWEHEQARERERLRQRELARSEPSDRQWREEDGSDRRPAPVEGSFADVALQWTAWLAIGLMLAFLAFWLIRAVLLREPAASDSEDDDESSGKSGADRIGALPLPVRQGPLSLLEQARQYYQQGNFGRAIVCLFAHQLVQLDKRRIIRLARGKTNRQYLREVGRQIALQGILKQSMVAFEDVFFGKQQLDRTRFESCWSRVDEFESLVQDGVG